MSRGRGAPRPTIHRLDPDTVARIAAGEVVEGPASVVKELVENALDASASEIRISVDQGGIGRIRVADDGSGIPEAELPLAVERHATSKLAGAAGLDRITSLGFRGEALAAIASVSRLTILSRAPGVEAAHGLRVEGGRVVGEFVEGAPPGTTVEVADLFYNTPARRKFLRSAAAELVDVTGTVGALYLSRPEVSFTLVSEGREVARYPSAASLADAAVRVLGEELVGQTVEVRAEEAGCRIDAVVGRPAVSRGSSRSIHVAVNGRSVAAPPFVRAVRFAFDDYLPRTRFPVGVVHVELDPSRVDVNVHPAKREIRIALEREIAERIRRSVRSALRSAPQTSERARGPPAGRRLPTPAGRAPSPPEPLSVPLAFGPMDGAYRQSRLVEPEPPRIVGRAGGHPRVVLLGAVFSLYWIAEADAALVLVDQHAASERVVYEEILRTGKLARQELVAPVPVPLTARQAAVLGSHAEAIASSGYSVEPFGRNVFRVTSLPVYRGRLARADGLPALLDELAEGGRPTVPNGLVERTAASIACHTGVRAGDPITAEEMGRILEALYRLPETSYACPHGRPIVIRLPRERLDRWFLRSGE